MNATNTARRNLLRFLAASPLVAAPSVASSIAALFASTPNEALAQSYDVLRGAAQKLDADGVINSPAQALNVFDFEPAAKKALADAPAHFGYLASGVDVDRVLGLVQDEFVTIVRQAGTLRISAINAKYLRPATRPVHALGTGSGRKYDLAD
jgi:hypothetical protein